MKRTLSLAIAGLGLALVSFVAFTPGASASEDEVALIRQRCGAFVDAWNRHDPKAMASGFLDDADMIGPTGVLVQTRTAIEKQFVADHTGTGPMRESTLEVKDEPVRLLTPDVAISDARVVVTGAYGPGGAKADPIPLQVTNLWKKSGGEWRIAASRSWVVQPQPGTTSQASR